IENFDWYNEPAIYILKSKRYNQPYLHAQSGVFTNIFNADRIYLSSGKYPSIEHAVAINNKRISQKFLHKITLPTKYAEQLLRLLWVEGINKVKLMPTLDNAAKSVMDKWKINPKK